MQIATSRPKIMDSPMRHHRQHLNFNNFFSLPLHRGWLSYLLLATLWMLALEPTEASKNTTNGGQIFHDYCSVCHGDRGDGRSRARGSLIPPPRDFTAPNAIRDLTRDRMIFSVSYGRPNTAMASWEARLNRAQIESVVDYIRRSFMKLDTTGIGVDQTINLEDSAIEDGVFDPAYMNQQMPFNLAGVTEWGKIFYDDNCAVCHGELGDGRGPRSYFILPKPRDYRHPASRHKLNRPRLFEVIAGGSHGSEMPAWDKVLTYQEIAHVSEYIFQTFIQPESEE